MLRKLDRMNQKHINILIGTLSLSTAFSASLYAQKGGGEVHTDDIIIVKQRVIEIPQASRIFEKIPIAGDNGPKKELAYPYTERKIPVQTPAFSPTVKMPEEYGAGSIKEQSYNNVIRGGFGNYGHTFLEGHGGIHRGENNYHGIYIKHNAFRLGPVRSNFSGESQNIIKLHSRTVVKNDIKLEGAVGWERRGFDYYGYSQQPIGDNITEPSIFNSWNKFFFNGSFSNAYEKAKVDYQAKANASYLFTHLKTTELVLSGGLSGVLPLTDRLSAGLEGSVVLAQTHDTTNTVYRNLYRLKPTFFYRADKFSVTAGLNLLNDREKVSYNQNYVYPIIKVDFQPFEGIRAFAGYEGDMYANNLTSLLLENKWLGRNSELRNTRKSSDLYVGAKASISGFDLEAKVSYAKYNDFYVFTNAVTDSSRFDIRYTNANVMNLSGQAAYQIPQMWRSLFKFDLFVYSGLDNVEKAWHRPNFTATWNNTFSIKDKFLVSSDIFMLTGLKGKNFKSNVEESLPMIFDLNFKFTYVITDQLNLFVSANNVLNKNYQRYLYYPQQGVNFLAGLSFSF